MSDECVACRRPPANVHHIVEKGGPYFGDDVVENLLLLCGSGTMGCHGAFHGNPYVVEVGEKTIFAGGPVPTAVEVRPLVERRDAEWVARRIGRHLIAKRSDSIAYILDKLGIAAFGYLERTYYVSHDPEKGWI